jgi:hypothetical protein
MTKSKNILLILLVTIHLPHYLQADYLSDTASGYLQQAWTGTKNLYCKTVNSFSAPKNDDPRIYILAGLGILTSCLGLWIIKKGIDTITHDDVKLLQKQLGNNQNLIRGLVSTAFGVICATTGIILIATSKPIIKTMK